MTTGNDAIGDRLDMRGAQGLVEIDPVADGQVMIGMRVAVNWRSKIVAYVGTLIGCDCRRWRIDSTYRRRSPDSIEPGATVAKSKISIGRNDSISHSVRRTSSFGVTVRCVGKRYAQHFRVLLCLLKSVSGRFVRGFGFNNGNRNVSCQSQEAIHALGRLASETVSSGDNASIRDRSLFSD